MGTFNQSLQCTQDVFIGFQAPSPPVMGGLSFQDFITLGSIAAWRHLKRLSLALYYAAQMKRCTQKWDHWDNQGPGTEAVNFCWQLVGVIGTGLYHSMADVQMVVSCGCGPT